MRACIRSLFPVLLIVFTTAIEAMEQSTIAIRGRVADASGGVVAGATIEAVVADRRFATATSAKDGTYRVEVPRGVPLDLRVSLAGFADQTLAIPGQHGDATRDVVLPVAGLSDTLIVTATRAPASRAAVTESVTAFTQQDIQALGSASLADVMRFVPAVSVESNGRDGAVASMFSRGGESDYNLVLIDGVRANQS